MEVSFVNEAVVFLITLAGGMVIGVVFDIYRIIKDGTYKSVIVYTLSDIIVWIVLSILAFETVFIANNAVVRWFEIVALLVGYILYTVTISKYFLKAAKVLTEFAKKTVIILFKPVKLVLKLLFKPFVMLFYWLKQQKSKLKFIKNQQKLKIRQINRIFHKN